MKEPDDYIPGFRALGFGLRVEGLGYSFWQPADESLGFRV